MMKITFLGTSGAVPSVERGMPAIAVHAKELFLFDCGEGTQRQMMKYKVGYGSVKAIFISHLHLDHFLGIYGLLETLKLNSPSPRPIKIFAPRKFESLLINRHSFVDVIPIKPGLLYENDECEISAFEVEHGCEAYGFVVKEKDRRKFDEKKAHGLGLKGKMFREIQEKGVVSVAGKKIKLDDVSHMKEGAKVVLSGDTLPCKSVERLAKGAALLIHEATFSEEQKEESEERFHTSAKTAATIANRAGVQRLILTHVSARFSDASILENEAKSVFSSVQVAKDGMVVDVK
ncbi:MAG: ribonuclease Z [Candidatus Micrarchaeia archaeon]|jgi:ribonuclease Z